LTPARGGVKKKNSCGGRRGILWEETGRLKKTLLNQQFRGGLPGPEEKRKSKRASRFFNKRCQAAEVSEKKLSQGLKTAGKHRKPRCQQKHWNDMPVAKEKKRKWGVTGELSKINEGHQGEYDQRSCAGGKKRVGRGGWQSFSGTES